MLNLANQFRPYSKMQTWPGRTSELAWRHISYFFIHWEIGGRGSYLGQQLLLLFLSFTKDFSTVDGGATNLGALTAVDRSGIANGQVLKFNSSTNKFDFGEVASDLSAVDQDIIPDGNGTRSLGSASKRFKDIFLAGETINLGGATISSDGTGTVAVSAAGVTLPAGSKAGVNKIAVAVTGSGGTEQSATIVPFFSAAGGLSTANANFNFNATVDDKFVYTGSKTFTLANGSDLADSNITLFQF